MTHPRSLALLGCDYPDLGPLAITGLPDGGAIALSRGAHPKPYRHVDPNEDAALLVRTDEGALLAVADGHNGRMSAELAIRCVCEHAAELIPARGQAFAAHTRGLIAGLMRRMGRVGRSRTCLALTAIQGEDCHFAIFGDCSVWRANAAEPQSVPNDLILGPGLQLQDVPEALWSGYFRCDPDERVAVVSDGITNFVPDIYKICLVLRDAEDDCVAVGTLADSALTGGAGDNLAAATIARPSCRP
jgi:serine/threonine protein phosphatase PrpC